MRVLKRTARKLGVRFIDKTSLTDLLTDGGRVAGAVGFSLLDGAPIVIKAPAAIIATGGQSYRIMGMWSCQRGDGLGMAWRAGAQMRNAEWGPFAQLAGNRGKEPLIGAEDALYNAWHEKLSPTFRGEYEADVCGMTSAVWYQQMKAGNGPLVTFHPENWMLANTTEDVEGGTVWDRPEAVKFWTTLISRMRAADAPGAFLEVYPAVLGELSPIRVDHQMATSVPGLYACGNACYNGSGLPGAVPASPGRMRGAGLYGATFMGIRAGEAAASAAAAAAEADVAQAEALVRDAARSARPRRRPRHGPRPRHPGRREPGRLLDLQERGAHDRGARHGAGRQGAPAAGGGQGPALPGGRPRRAQHGAERRALLPHGAHAQGVARLVHPRGLPGARRRGLAQVGLRRARRRRHAHLDRGRPGRRLPVPADRREELTMAATMERQPAPLTPEEQARPYAKFYTMEFPGPDPETVALMSPDRPIPQDQMLPAEEMSRLLDPGNFETEVGWGMMDNGAGYIAMRHEMPGVTVDMVDWWFAWHPIEGLRYRIWYPPYHLGVHVDDWAQPRLLDPGVPVRDKCEKVVHHVTEDTGMGTEHIDIHFLTPEQMGFDMSRWHKPNVGTFVGGFGWSLNEHQPPEIPAAPAIMVHFIREMDGGVEWRTRFWMGYTILNGHPVPLLPPGIRVPEPVVFGLANHNIYEYTRLKSLLPLVYEEFGGTFA